MQRDVHCIIPTTFQWLHSHSGVQMKALFPTISSTCHKELPREDSCPSNTCNLVVPPPWSTAELWTKQFIWQDFDTAERGVWSVRQMYHTVKQHHTQGQLGKATSHKTRNKPVLLETSVTHRLVLPIVGVLYQSQLPCVVLWQSLLPLWLSPGQLMCTAGGLPLQCRSSQNNFCMLFKAQLIMYFKVTEGWKCGKMEATYIPIYVS